MSEHDEFYEFKGDPTYGKPPYWVSRAGRRVTSQVEGRDVESVDCSSLEESRAEFADATCEPDGPGAPMPGDVVRIVWGPAEGETFIVESVVARGSQFGVTGNRSGRPLTLLFGQYRIVSRPAA